MFNSCYWLSNFIVLNLEKQYFQMLVGIIPDEACGNLVVQFARLYPLDQRDMSPAPRHVDFLVPIPQTVNVENSARDYTPPQYLTLLFTDLGILTPSAVSDELIQLYL